MRPAWIALILLLPGCAGVDRAELDFEGTELVMDRSSLEVVGVGRWTDWSDLRLGADRAVQFEANGQSARVVGEPAALFSGPIEVGQRMELCATGGPGKVTFVVETTQGGRAQFDIDVEVC